MKIGSISLVVDQGEQKPRVQTIEVYPSKQDAEAEFQGAAASSSTVPETMEKITSFVANKDNKQKK